METETLETETLIDDGLDANMEAVNTILQQYAESEGATLAIKRQIGAGNEPMESIMSCAASDYPDMDKLTAHIAENWGGGKYRVWVQINKKTVKNIPLLIAHPLKKPDTQNSDLANAFKYMADQQRESMRELRTLLLTQKSTVDPVTQAVSLVGAMSGMMQNLIGKATGKGGDVDPLDFVERALSLNERLNDLRGDGGSEEKEPWYSDALKAAMPIFAAALPTLIAPKQTTLPPAIPGDAQPIPPAVPTQIEGAPVNQQFEANPMNLNKLPAIAIVQYAKQYIPQIAGFIAVVQNGAILGSDPASYATLILDGLPPNVEDEQIQALLTRPDALDILLTLVPAATPYRDWYGEVLKMMLAEITEATSESGESENGAD